jgi:amino acid transporter
VTLLPLLAATYFMVSGGPFGIEDLVAGVGYGKALALLFITPVVWSLPTALAVGELASAYPEEGGYYAWVRRGLGPFWGVQEAWLSLAASLFDLAIYPTLFTRYLAQLWAPAASAPVGILVGVGLIAACTALNLRGARVATDASVLLGVALLCPFAALVLAAWTAPTIAPAHSAETSSGGLFAGLAVAMWNYMGWDSPSTIAAEVEDPSRTYPRTIFLAMILVTVTYVVPVAAVFHTGLAPSAWTEGTWALAGEKIGGHGLAVAIAIAGMVSSAGMLTALVMSYSRLPLALAKDGYLPKWLGRKGVRTGAPILSLVALGVAYSACLGLGFQRLVELDVMIYGASLALEFAALVMLRVKEPRVVRRVKVPGGIAGAALVGVLPMGLLAWMLAEAGNEGGRSATVLVAAGLIAMGPVIYLVHRLRRIAHTP